jgi:hypothetical protein
MIVPLLVFLLILQIGVGTGAKAGVNVWRAVRNVQEAHPAWAHLEGTPVTEADLMLPLRVTGGTDAHAEVVGTLQGLAASQQPTAAEASLPEAASSD